MNSKEERYAELRKKETLTDGEFRELIQLSPPGTFWSLPSLQEIGVVDVEKAFQNLKEGPDRTGHAMRNKCYLEVISLRLQHAEFWLRMYWVAKNPRRRIFDLDDRRTFGNLVKDCACLGFRHDLVCRLKTFNRDRVDAIHRYLLGATDYDDLKKVCEDSTGLDGDVGEYVKQEIRPLRLLH